MTSKPDLVEGLKEPEINPEEEEKLEAAFLKMNTSADDIETMREMFGSLRGFQLAMRAARTQEHEAQYAIMHAFGFARFAARQEKALLDCIRQQAEFIQAVNELTMSDNRHAMIFASMLVKRYRGPNLVVTTAGAASGVVS